MSQKLFFKRVDSIMVEIYPNPEITLSDSKQQLILKKFNEMFRKIRE